MLYDLTKAAHILSLFVWIGGMVTVALALRCPTLLYVKPLKTYDRAVTTPAMILALALGIFLGAQGDWFTSTWMSIKILAVLALAGLHGALVGRLRRVVLQGSYEGKLGGRWFLPVGLMLITLIILLVTIKP